MLKDGIITVQVEEEFILQHLMIQPTLKLLLWGKHGAIIDKF